MKSQLTARMTEAEFLALPETTARVELIDGELVASSPAASYGHQEILCRLVGSLRAWAHGRTVTVVQSPRDVRFGDSRILQPDAFVILDRVPLATSGPLERIPELCIEVLSRDVRHDRQTKRLLYAAAGVKELWLVDRSGVVERWTGEGLRHAESVTAVLRTPLLDGFELDVPRLVAEEP